MAGLCAQTGVINRHAKFLTVFNALFLVFFKTKEVNVSKKFPICVSKKSEKVMPENVWFVATRETMCLVGYVLPPYDNVLLIEKRQSFFLLLESHSSSLSA